MTPMHLARSLPLLLACSCGHPPPTVVTALPDVASRPSESATADASSLVIVPPKLADPPWLEPVLADEPGCMICRIQRLAIGESAALVATDKGDVFANVLEEGVMGPMLLPADREWIGLGKGNRPFVADASGQLWSADDLESARTAENWRRRGRVAGATHWDISSSRIVATDAARVFVSSDAGETFRAGPSLAGVMTVLVRDDGLIAVLLAGRGDEHEIRISRDDGRTWNRSKLRAEKLVRRGAWLTNGEKRLDCEAVLAADGRTWVRPTRAEQAALENTRHWGSAVVTRSDVQAFVEPSDRETLVHPSAPTVVGHRVIAGPRACRPAKPGLVDEVPLRSDVASRSTSIRGVARLRRSSAPGIPATASDVEFFRDATCAAAHDGGYGLCKHDAALTRQPHLARIDHSRERVRVDAVPRGCERPEETLPVRGLGILMCGDGDGTRMFAAERDGSWRDEGRLDVRRDFRSRSTGIDGTLLLALHCPETESCRTLVRAPMPAGDAAAWRLVAIPGAVTYRAGTMGSVIAIVQPDPEVADRMQIVLARPDAEPELLADMRIAGDPHDVQVLADGRVRLEIREGGRTAAKLAFFVRRSGDLVPIEPTPVR
jgi:hypothetical protein